MMGVTSPNAARPPIGTRMRRISSVAYADEDMTSEESTASAVGLPSFWLFIWSLIRGGPSSLRFNR